VAEAPVAGDQKPATLEANPSRQSTAEELWALYQKGEHEQVVKAAGAALPSNPDSIELNLVMGRALADLGRWEEARTPLERAAALDQGGTWRKAWAWVFLGRTYFALGQETDSRRVLLEAVELNATRNATADARGLLRLFGLTTEYAGATGRESDHFRWVFSTDLKGMDEAAFARAHEEAFHRISAVFGDKVPRKIRFFVWGSDEDAARAGVRSLGFARPEYCLIHSRVNQTVGHELTHVLAHHGLKPRHKTGLISEGTAVFFDGRAGDRMARATGALRGRSDALQLETLWLHWDRWPDAVSYPVAGAWVGRLIDRGGQAAFLDFFPDQTLEHARAVYGAELGVWMQEFDAELAGAQGGPAAGSPAPPAGEESEERSRL
jgi:hypothetical protein